MPRAPGFFRDLRPKKRRASGFARGPSRTLASHVGLFARALPHEGARPRALRANVVAKSAELRVLSPGGPGFLQQRSRSRPGEQISPLPALPSECRRRTCARNGGHAGRGRRRGPDPCPRAWPASTGICARTRGLAIGAHLDPSHRSQKGGVLPVGPPTPRNFFNDIEGTALAKYRRFGLLLERARKDQITATEMKRSRHCRVMTLLYSFALRFACW